MLYEDAIYTFCIEFYSCIIKGCKVVDAFYAGKAAMEDNFVTKNDRSQIYSNKTETYKGSGAILHAQGDAEEVLFTHNAKEATPQTTYLYDGPHNDISRFRCATNLEKSSECFIGRN